MSFPSEEAIKAGGRAVWKHTAGWPSTAQRENARIALRAAYAIDEPKIRADEQKRNLRLGFKLNVKEIEDRARADQTRKILELMESAPSDMTGFYGGDMIELVKKGFGVQS